MSLPSLFIGLISHRNSQYSDSQSTEGLAAQLAVELAAPHLTNLVQVVNVQVNLENLYQGSEEGLSEKESVKAELNVERKWTHYLDRPDKRDAWITRQKRLARFLTRRQKHWSGSSVKRLLNIELSHRDLWEAGITSGADWILILEDDAYCSQMPDLAEGLTALIASADSGNNIAYVNLSASFSAKTLGVKHLLHVAKMLQWQGSALRVVYECEKPVTNTVCAIMYSRKYLTQLVSVWDSLPMSPVLPIDWKMNRAIMVMESDSTMDIDPTLWIEPAPILQRSMHTVVT